MANPVWTGTLSFGMVSMSTGRAGICSRRAPAISGNRACRRRPFLEYISTGPVPAVARKPSHFGS